MISVCKKGGHRARALQLPGAMVQGRVARDAITRDAAISMRKRGSEWVGAVEFASAVVQVWVARDTTWSEVGACPTPARSRGPGHLPKYKLPERFAPGYNQSTNLMHVAGNQKYLDWVL